MREFQHYVVDFLTTVSSSIKLTSLKLTPDKLISLLSNWNPFTILLKHNTELKLKEITMEVYKKLYEVRPISSGKANSLLNIMTYRARNHSQTV